jgi:hypothetical protein
MAFNWGGKKWTPAGKPKNTGKINQSIDELLKPLSEKSFKGNVWGSQIMNVQKDATPAPTPSVTPSVSVSPSVTPSSTPTPTVTPSITPTPSPVPLSFQQTDTDRIQTEPPLNSNCSGWQRGDDTIQKTATVGGTAGTSTYTLSMDNNNTKWLFFSKLTIPSGTNWNAGTWTVRLQVGSTGNNNVVLSRVYICRINSSNVSQATIGSNLSVDTTVTANSVISVNITGSAQTPSANDYVNVVYVFSNSVGTPSTQSFTVKSDQIINSPYF